MTNTLNRKMWFLLLVLFINACGDDLPTFELPSELEMEVDISNINTSELNFKIRNTGDFTIQKVGFMYAYESFNCDDNVDEIDAQYNSSTDTYAANIGQLRLGASLFIRGFVILQNSQNGEIRRLCSELQNTITGTIRLSTSFEIVGTEVNLIGSIDGLEGNTQVSEYGHFWISSNFKLSNPELRFDTSLIQRTTNANAFEDLVFVERVDTAIALGKYNYVKSYAFYEEELIVSETTSEIFIGDFWESLEEIEADDSPSFLGEGIAFELDGIGYVGLGFKVDGNGSRGPSNEWWAYHPEEHRWERKADFPGPPRVQPAGFVLDNKIYVGTGSAVSSNGSVRASNTYRDFYMYDETIDEWIPKDSFPSKRFGAASFSIGSLGYIGLGYFVRDDGSRQGYSSVLYEFDPADTTNGFDKQGNPLGIWTRKLSLSFNGLSGSRRSTVSFSNDKFGFIGTGVRSSGFSGAFYKYDPTDSSELDDRGNPTGSWELIESMPISPRQGGAVFIIGKKAYITGGQQYELPTLNDLWEMDLETYTFTARADISTFNVSNAQAFTINGRGYVYGGYTATTISTFSKRLRRYTPLKEILEAATDNE